MKNKLFFLGFLLFFGCVSNEQPEIDKRLLTGLSIDPNLIQSFDQLNKQIGNGELSIENQLNLLYTNAVGRKLAFNSNRAFRSLNNKSESIPDVSKEHQEMIFEDIELLNSFILPSTSKSEALDFINKYKSKLGQSKYQRLSTAELDILKESVKAVEFLVATDVGRQYLSNVPLLINAKSSKETKQSRVSASLWDCIQWSALIAYYGYSCATKGAASDCALLAYYSTKFAIGCLGLGGGGYVNPCAGSSDPCCGISCITGYYCWNGQCEIDYSYTPPGCPEGSFWNGIECVYP